MAQYDLKTGTIQFTSQELIAIQHLYSDVEIAVNEMLNGWLLQVQHITAEDAVKFAQASGFVVDFSVADDAVAKMVADPSYEDAAKKEAKLK